MGHGERKSCRASTRTYIDTMDSGLHESAKRSRGTATAGAGEEAGKAAVRDGAGQQQPARGDRREPERTAGEGSTASEVRSSEGGRAKVSRAWSHV